MPFERELAAYRRELPRLLDEGEAEKYVLIKEDQVLSVWDTYRDARQYGRERFGDELFMVQRVDPRDPSRLAALFPEFSINAQSAAWAEPSEDPARLAR